MKSLYLTITLLFSLFLAACGGSENNVDPNPEPEWKNTPGTIVAASPETSDGELGVGDYLTVIGSNFIAKDKGTALLSIKGMFYIDGESHLVDRTEKVEYLNQGKLRWRLWPNIVFDPLGKRLGAFTGEVRVINEGKDGSREISNTQLLTFTIRPSLIPIVVSPSSGECQAIVSKTIQNTGFNFVVEAAGLRPATPEAPIIFYWSFLHEQWDVDMNNSAFDVNSILPKSGVFMLQDVVTSGVSSSITDQGGQNFIVKLASEIYSGTELKRIMTKAELVGTTKSSINVTAVDAIGKQINISIPLTIEQPVSITGSMKSELVERFDPVLTTGCMDGGINGKNISYSESESETHARSMSFQYNANGGANIAPFINHPFLLQLNFSGGFGVDVNSSASTTNSTSLDYSAYIYPGMKAACYRQTTQWRRKLQLTGHTVCGEDIYVGDAVLTDWTYTPDIATGPECIPESNLQPAYKAE